jgi:hypothetical protein
LPNRAAVFPVHWGRGDSRNFCIAIEICRTGRKDLDHQNRIADQLVAGLQPITGYGDIGNVEGVVAIGANNAGLAMCRAGRAGTQCGVDRTPQTQDKGSVSWHLRRHRHDEAVDQLVAGIRAILPPKEIIDGHSSDRGFSHRAASTAAEVNA